MLKKLASHSLIYGLGPYLSKVITVFISPILTQYYTKEDYGIWGTVQAYTGFVTSLSILGMSFAFNYTFFHYRNRYKWQWRQYYGFLLLWSVIYSILLGTVISIFIPDAATGNRILITILIVLPAIFMGPAGQIGPFYFQLRQTPKPVAIVNIVSILVSIFTTYVTVVVFKIGYMGFVWSYAISSLVSNCIYAILIQQAQLTPIFNFKKSSLRRGLKLSLPNIPHFYSYFLLGGMDKVIMDRSHIDVGSIGIYSQGVAMSGNVGAAVGAVHTALGVMLYDLLAKKAYSEIRDLIWKVQSLFWLSTVLASLWMKEIFSFLIRNETVVAYPIAVILIMALNHKPLYILASAELGYNGRVTRIWIATFSAGLIAMLLNILLIPLVGYKAVAFVMFIAWQAFGIGMFLLRDYKECVRVKINYRVIFTINFFLLMVLMLIDLSIIVKLICTGALLIVVLLLIRKFLIMIPK